MRIETPCPAKVNLFLAVGPRDVTGYHPIRTRFQAISLTDHLAVETSGADAFVCDWPGMPADNTVTKTLRLLREISVVPQLRIELTKRVPPQSGLGGGSSDAAGLLRIVDAFLPAPLSAATKRDVALAVGADVPFFLVGGHAKAEGYGEALTPLDDLPETHLVIVRPAEGSDTRGAYARLDERPYPWREFPDDLEQRYNDFERVMSCECDEFLDRLQVHGALRVSLSGSGSAVFGEFVSREAAIRGAEALSAELRLPLRGPSETLVERHGGVWVCRTLGREESLRTGALNSLQE